MDFLLPERGDGMTRIALTLGVLLSLHVTPARTQPTQTYVSGTGSSSLSCGARTTPCQFLSTALTNTAAGGTIFCLDTVELSGAIIDKSIVIDCSGGAGGPGNGNAFVIPNPAARWVVNGSGIVVILRGLRFDGGELPLEMPSTS